MINCQNSSKRLKVTREELEGVLKRLGIYEEIPKLELTLFETKKLLKYLQVFIPQLTQGKYDEIDSRYSTMREIILAITCFSDDVKNLEAIWITFKIMKNEIMDTKETQQVS